MYLVLLTALGVGGATVLGALPGFIFRDRVIKYSSLILSYAAGVMMFAALTALILPALEYGGMYGGITVSIGIFAGGFCILLPEKLFPQLGGGVENNAGRRAFLTVLAIALHNLPEGIAAGVGFGSGDISGALFIALGIALQNIPEGCVVVAPLIGTGMSAGKAFGIAALTGLIEVFGTFFGYFAVSISKSVLPFALSFAGGAMLYVIVCEMIPEICGDNSRGKVLAAFLLGVCTMVMLS